MIRVALVDDQALIRMAVAQLIDGHDDIEVVGEAVDGRDGLALVQRTRPDVALMDIRMPRMDGIEATRAICSDPALSGTRVMILTTFEEDAYVLEALRAGASGFIGKGTDPADLVEAVRVVHAGEALLSPRATRALVDRFISSPAGPSSALVPPNELQLLTAREREILVLVASGLSNSDIAAHLVISTQTAKTHINRTMSKLGAHDRAQLVIIAYEAGLLIPGGS